ncbi:relaxin-3 [Paroedura picta]|uniref:relaxin-3 n=1 Tax=Paroedura picta TaxID=143630 RepID=UPI001013E100
MRPAMHKLLLALVLGLLWSEMRPGSEARTPPYGVKLCGREFIRAVIFTCGGSRWRRAGELSSLPGGDSTEAFVATSSSSEWDSLRVPPKDPSDYFGSWRSRSASDEPWALDRGARDVMAGLSSACCKWGCSKSDISSLC